MILLVLGVERLAFLPAEIDGVWNEDAVLLPALSIRDCDELVHELGVGMQVAQMSSIPLRGVQWEDIEKEFPNNRTGRNIG